MSVSCDGPWSGRREGGNPFPVQVCGSTRGVDFSWTPTTGVGSLSTPVHVWGGSLDGGVTMPRGPPHPMCRSFLLESSTPEVDRRQSRLTLGSDRVSSRDYLQTIYFPVG